jgi:hypothetical protein
MNLYYYVITTLLIFFIDKKGMSLHNIKRKYLININWIIPFRFQRITRRQGGGSAGVLLITNTLRKLTTLPTKLAKESKLVSVIIT